MSTSEREDAKEKVNYWDRALRNATTEEIGLCERRLTEANAIYLATINQQQAATAPVGN